MPLGMLGRFVLAASLTAAASPTTETFAIRGRQETLHVYGARGGPAAVVASGDGGWEHLAPHIAEFLASSGYFVVGLDSKAYLSSFTKNGTTLSVADVPHDFAALVDHVLGLVLYPVIQRGAWAATTEFKLNLLAPVRTGQLTAEATIVSMTKRTAVVQIAVTNDDRLAGLAQGTVLVMPPKK